MTLAAGHPPFHSTFLLYYRQVVESALSEPRCLPAYSARSGGFECLQHSRQSVPRRQTGHALDVGLTAATRTLRGVLFRLACRLSPLMRLLAGPLSAAS